MVGKAERKSSLSRPRRRWEDDKAVEFKYAICRMSNGLICL